MKPSVLSNRGYAVFAMQSLLRNHCRAYLEPTFADKQIIGIHRSEQSWLCSLCYEIFAMQSLPSLPRAYLCQRANHGNPIALSNRGYAVLAMQSLLRNRCGAYLEPSFANKQIIGIHCSEQSWLCSLCFAMFAVQPLPSLP